MKRFNEILQKAEDRNGRITPFGEKLFKILAFTLIVLVFLVALFIASGVGIFNWLETEVRAQTGLDVLLAKSVVFALFAIFFGTPLGGFVWSLLPIPQKNKKRKRFIFLSVLAVLCFVSYFTSKNVYFSPENGKPLKYFSVGVNGEYNFSNSDGYDPITGDKLQQVDRATVIQYLKGASTSRDNNLVDAGENALIGLEKNARFYPVEFKNKTNKNLYLCITFRNDVNGPVIIQRIASRQMVKLSLMEGRHFFGYIDNNGSSYGDRKEPQILDKLTILTKVSNSFNVLIDKQFYQLNKTFSLDVMVSDNQIVTLKEKSVLHNKEFNGTQEGWAMFLLGFPMISLLLYLQYKLRE